MRKNNIHGKGEVNMILLILCKKTISEDIKRRMDKGKVTNKKNLI